jgi:hypothetical protein
VSAVNGSFASRAFVSSLARERSIVSGPSSFSWKSSLARQAIALLGDPRGQNDV